MSTVVVDKVESDPEEEARLERIKKKPDVTECFNLMDFEVNRAPSMRLTVGCGKTSDEENCMGILFLGSRRRDHIARKPQRLPKNLVSPQNPYQRRKSRLQHYHARHQSIHANL